MPRSWIREALADRGRVDPTEYAMALFGVRGDAEHAEELARDLTDDPEDWQQLAERRRRYGRR